MSESKTRAQLLVRNATLSDADGIAALAERVYPDMPPYPKAMLIGQINAFPDGVWVAELGGEIVGYCATICVSSDMALKPHTWREITGGGYGSTHDAGGKWLYGYEVCVDPRTRRYRIGQRFYRERRRLCEFRRLKGIVIAGRIPGYKRSSRRFGSPEQYVEAVREKKARDPVLSFQIRNGFEPVGILRDYLPHDRESGGYAVHLVWRNPQVENASRPGPGPQQPALPIRVRIATVQYGQRRIESFDEFRKMVLYFVDVTADYRADFVVFPELLTMQLLSIENEAIPPHEAIAHLADYEPQLIELFRDAAVRFNINIVAGSTPVRRGEAIRNVAHVFLRDGSIASQEKIHPTPNERYWWNIEGGDELTLIDTDCGPVGVLICYDSEFPELVRHLVDQGINILFVPFLTDERQSYLRVRYCAQARAVENQLYVVMSGSCGNLPNVNNIDIHYAQSCILTPCDFPFARDGIAADTTPNVETVALADLSLRALREARQTGTVQNLKDRRHDLYGVTWHGRQKKV
ncbi:MAG: carbon-nitrogen hydrolase [Chromatiales bacterium]|nr:carbon-nitrogen hydrolase [Chromatiales bacterium]